MTSVHAAPPISSSFIVRQGRVDEGDFIRWLRIKRRGIPDRFGLAHYRDPAHEQAWCTEIIITKYYCSSMVKLQY